MRKRSALLIGVFCFLFTILTSGVKAQEWVGDAILTNQAQVDAFNYTSVTGNLAIYGFTGAITNLNGLSALVSVGNSLVIRDNPALVNLSGLSSLKSIGGIGFEARLAIENNQNLASLDGLQSLEEVDVLTIINNPSLTNIDALSVLTPNKINRILIEKNDALINLDGLSGITEIWSIDEKDINLMISDNDALNDIDGLSNITKIKGRILIQLNANLTNLDGLSALTEVDGNLEIWFNGLVNIDGLSQLKKVSGLLYIAHNSLTNLDGLISLEEAGILSLSESSLENIEGLIHLKKLNGGLIITSNHKLTNLNGLANLEQVGKGVLIRLNFKLTDFCGLYNLFNSGTIGGGIEITFNGANTVAVQPPPNIIVNTDPGSCSATITNAATLIGAATPVGCLPEFTISHNDLPAGNSFPIGNTNITWQVIDGAGNTASAIQTITVVDNQPPTITCPANITVKCASDVPIVDINSVTVTDNCLAVVSHLSDVISNQSCENRFTLTRTYKVTDAGNNTATCSQTITVYDDIPPQIIGLNVSQQTLWPPNHTMRDINLNYTVSDNCVKDTDPVITITSNEPVNGTADGDTDPDWEVIDDHHIRLRAERAANGNGRIYTITITLDDGCNPPVSQSKQVMIVHNITGPQSGKPFKIGSTVNFTGEFWDDPLNKHTAKWLIDENTVVKGIVTEPTVAKNGQVTGSYKFTSPGVYKLQMNITDQNGLTSFANTNGDLDAIVVIYDPNGGNTYGGGYFNSPAGALRSNPSATGKASYGFSMNYFKNSTYPKGETQFEFKVGSFEFNALNFEYLVISNSMAQFKGTGKIIGGQSGVAFIMTVTDGQLDGTGIDKIRMKIFNKNNGSVIYDNQAGAGDAVLPIQAVGANSTIVISGNNNSNLTQANTTQKAEVDVSETKASNGIKAIAYPNPTANSFSISVETNSTEKVLMQVVDIYGRIIETRNVIVNSPILFGERYKSGTYFVKLMQGKQYKEIKLIKLTD